MKNIIYENKTLPINTYSTYGLSPQPHLHKEVEMVYVVDGESVAVADNKRFHLKKGDVFISFPNQVHYYEGSVIGEYYLFIFKPSVLFGLKDVFYENIPTENVFSILNDNSLIGLLNKAVNCCGNYSDTIKAGYLNQLLADFLQKLNLVHRSKTDHSSLSQILNFCLDNFEEQISLDCLSDALNLNKYYISHLFNQKLGVNFNSYINILRINKACELLLETDNKIIDISECVGFGSVRTFNRAFTKIMNTSPKEYRNSFR